MEKEHTQETADTDYERCRNCGEYVARSRMVRDYYCSEACACTYARCTTCGGYFLTSESEYEHFCSADCREGYYTPAIPAEYIHMHTHEEEESLL
jgi:endogenous inhibitor of DNA gyrase (YacG/DUF329 family)